MLRARPLCRHASNFTRAKDERTVWTSYADTATIRRRLAGVAQEVRELIEQSSARNPLPQLILPRGERVRHGFWFMRFEAESLLHAARRELEGKRFESACGSMGGTLLLDTGSKHLDLRGILHMDATAPRAVDDWLVRAFSPIGQLESVCVPRLASNWDPGYGFVRFVEPGDAVRAIEKLDGTPSCVKGCNMLLDLAERKPLALLRTPPHIAYAT